jgi:hypothetical protein
MGLRRLFPRNTERPFPGPRRKAPTGPGPLSPRHLNSWQRFRRPGSNSLAAERPGGAGHFHACTRNGKSWQEDPASVRAVAALLRDHQSDEPTSRHPAFNERSLNIELHPHIRRHPHSGLAAIPKPGHRRDRTNGPGGNHNLPNQRGPGNPPIAGPPTESPGVRTFPGTRSLKLLINFLAAVGGAAQCRTRRLQSRSARCPYPRPGFRTNRPSGALALGR